MRSLCQRETLKPGMSSAGYAPCCAPAVHRHEHGIAGCAHPRWCSQRIMQCYHAHPEQDQDGCAHGDRSHVAVPRPAAAAAAVLLAHVGPPLAAAVRAMLPWLCSSGHGFGGRPGGFASSTMEQTRPSAGTASWAVRASAECETPRKRRSVRSANGPAGPPIDDQDFVSSVTAVEKRSAPTGLCCGTLAEPPRAAAAVERG